MNNLDTELQTALDRVKELETFKAKQEAIQKQLEEEELALSAIHQRQLQELAQFTDTRNRIIEAIKASNDFSPLLAEKAQIEQELGKVQDKMNKQMAQLKYFVQVLFTLHSQRIVDNNEANSPTTLQQIAFNRLYEDTRLDKHFLSDLLF